MPSALGGSRAGAPDCAAVSSLLDRPFVQRLRADERLLALCGATFLVMAGQGVVSPVTPLFAKDFGVSTTMVGLTLTVFAAARLVLNVPAGIIADRFGRRVLLIGGPIITSIGMFGSGAAGDIWTLLAWRFVAGAGSAFYMSGALVYLIDIAGPDRMSRYVATNQWALSLGVALGPGLGGLIADRYGLASPFQVVGALAIVAAVYAARRLPETRSMADTSAGADDTTAEGTTDDAPVTSRSAARTLLWSGPFLALAATTMTIFMIRAGARAVLVPLRADTALGWGPSEIGLVFTLTGAMTLFTLLPAARFADRVGRRHLILFSGVMAGLGPMLIASSTAPTVFVLGNVVMSLGTGTAGPAPSAFAADITPAHIRGLGVAIYRSAGDVGFLLGPFLLGWLSDETSIGTALVVAGALVAAAGAAFMVTQRHHPAAGPRVST